MVTMAHLSYSSRPVHHHFLPVKDSEKLRPRAPRQLPTCSYEWSHNTQATTCSPEGLAPHTVTTPPISLKTCRKRVDRLHQVWLEARADGFQKESPQPGCWCQLVPAGMGTLPPRPLRRQAAWLLTAVYPPRKGWILVEVARCSSLSTCINLHMQPRNPGLEGGHPTLLFCGSPPFPFSLSLAWLKPSLHAASFFLLPSLCQSSITPLPCFPCLPTTVQSPQPGIQRPSEWGTPVPF